MKTMNKKGQGAMEYLMTYGWAILVVLIVGIVLWQLGIFSGIGGGANRASGFNVLAPVDKTIYGTGTTVNFTLENRAGNAITITAVGTTVTGASSCTVYYNATTDLTIGTDPVPMSAGQSKDVECTVATAMLEGDQFAVELDITYEERIAGKVLTKHDGGTIRGIAD